MLSSRQLSLLAALILLILLPFAVLAQTPTPTAFPTLTPTQPVAVLKYGDTLQTIATVNTSAVVYSFNGHRGDVIAVKLTSQAGNWGLSLQDGVGVGLANGIFGPYSETVGYVEYILPLQLTADATYTIRIDNQYGVNGSFDLSLFTPVVNEVAFGRAVEGDLPANTLATYYSFNGKADDVVSIGLNSADFDAFLMAAPISLGGVGVQMSDNDGGGANALIGPFTLPSDDQTIIVVTRSNTRGGGHYSLLVKQVDVPMLAYGDSVEAVFTPQTNFYFYHFAAQTGDVVSIHVDSAGGLDTQLTLMDSLNSPMVADDDGANGYDPEVNNFVIGEAGVYGIKLYPFNLGGSSGQVTLTLSNQAPMSLDNGAQDIYVNAKQSSANAVFTATANEHIRLHLELASNINPIITVTQDGETIGSVSPSGFPNMTADFVVPKAGTVYIQVNSYLESHIRISVERLES